MDSTPAIRIYLREISATPLLTADDEVALAQRIEAGCMDARELLIRSNLRLVANIAKGYNIPTLPFLDLVSEGNIGLMKAVERFDWRKGWRFSTAATPWIEDAIKKAITDKGKLIRVPSSASKRMRREGAGGLSVISLDELRTEDEQAEPWQIPDTDTPDPAAAADTHDMVSRLKEALSRLSKKDRLALLKRFDLSPEIYAYA